MCILAHAQLLELYHSLTLENLEMARPTTLTGSFFREMRLIFASTSGMSVFTEDNIFIFPPSVFAAYHTENLRQLFFVIYAIVN